MGCDKIGLLVYFLSGVSIHAAQAGCDPRGCKMHLAERCFNSRSPSGLRPRHFNSTAFTKGFQFTQPKRAATYNCAASCGTRLVSIHAAQAGCDHVLPTSHGTKQSFNSRSPSGLRLAEGQGTTRQTRFNSRSPSGLRLSAFTAWLGL